MVYEIHPSGFIAGDKKSCDCGFTSSGTLSCNALDVPPGCTGTVLSCSGTKDASCACGDISLSGIGCVSPAGGTESRTCKWGYSSGTVQNAFSSEPSYNGFLFNAQGYSAECRIDDHMGTGLTGNDADGIPYESWSINSCKRTNGAQNVFSTSRSSDTISCRKSLLSYNTGMM